MTLWSRMRSLIVNLFRKQHVERGGNLDQRVDVAAEPRFLLSQRAGEACKIFVGPTLCREPGDLNLDDEPSLDELVRHPALQRAGDRRRLILAGIAGDEDALTVAYLDDPEHRQPVQCLAHC